MVIPVSSPSDNSNNGTPFQVCGVKSHPFIIYGAQVASVGV